MGRLKHLSYFGGKAILITGALGGLGTEMVRQLGEADSLLILTDIREIPTTLPRKTLAYIRADLGTREGCEGLITRCAEFTPALDMLINNAGLATVGHFVDVPANQWEAQITVNLVAPMRITQLVLPSMIARRSGHIVNISSVGGHVGLPKTATYAATKFGLRGFGTALSGEAALHNICVSNVYPTFTRTPILDSARFGYARSKEMPDYLIDKPEDVVRTMLEGISKRKLHIFPSRRAWAIAFLARVSPVFAAFLTRELAKRID